MVVDERGGEEDQEILYAFCGTKIVLILAYVSRAIKREMCLGSMCCYGGAEITKWVCGGSSPVRGVENIEGIEG